MARESNLLLRLGLDVLCVAIVGFPMLIFLLVGKPNERGFFCDDESIRYPYLKDTVSNAMLYAIGICSPMIVISVTEYVIYRKTVHQEQLVIYGRRIPLIILILYKRIGVFLFGACVSQLLTDIGKYSIGRLRPHFLDACQPDINVTKCVFNEHKYIQNFRCKNTDALLVRDSRLSFPSGHASFSAYTMLYIIIYLQYKMTCGSNKLLKPFLQVLALLTTWFISLSRISDYKHHWSDVLFGGLLGITVAFVVIKFISDLPIKNPDQVYEQHPLSTPSSTPLSNYNSCDNKDLEGGHIQR